MQKIEKMFHWTVNIGVVIWKKEELYRWNAMYCGVTECAETEERREWYIYDWGKERNWSEHNLAPAQMQCRDKVHAGNWLSSGVVH